MSRHRRSSVTAALAALFLSPAAAAPVEGQTTVPTTGQGTPGTSSDVERTPFGTMTDGHPVEMYTLHGTGGASASVLTYGATLARVRMPDRTGTVGDVLLGYDSLGQYQRDSGPYFGALVGRVSNRIAKGSFALDGATYHVPTNDHGNALHGGVKGYDKRLWTVATGDATQGPSVTLELTDPDGEQGFPGTVHVRVTYALTKQDTLRISYSATADKATPISLTSHGYWNLRDGGKTDVKGELMQWNADHYLPVNAVQIPTGQIAAVAGTPFDFRTIKPIGRDLLATGGNPPGYDHTMVINGPAGTLRQAATVIDPVSGREMKMFTTEPGVQFYTGNSLDGSIKGRDGVAYGRYHAFALEAQAFPDAINHKNFPDSVLKPGGTYSQTTEYRFGTGEHPPE